MRTYRDFCRPAHPVERTEKQPGEYEMVFGKVLRVPGQPNVVAMRRRKAVANV